VDAQQQAAGRPQIGGDGDLQARQAELRAFSGRIDRSLRRRYATLGLQRLLRPPRRWREHGRPVPVLAPSQWLVLAASLLLAYAALPVFLPQWWSRLPLPETTPQLSLVAAVALIALLVAIERLLLPRMALIRHRFRLVRLERTDGDPMFPFVFRVAQTRNAPTGFELQAWRSIRGMQAGDLAIAVSDAHDRGVALIPLRTAGRLPALVWDRDVYQHDALPTVTPAVRQLVDAFDRNCELDAQLADRIERSRALRSSQGRPVARDAHQIWAALALTPEVKLRLLALATHFATGSASASRGLLLYGPPGTGKTTIARAFADSMGCAFFSLSLADLKSGYVGQSGENVKALWQKARSQPRAVIFVDECEAVFGRRGGIHTDSFVEEIVAAFLAQWDGFERSHQVWVVGATNRRDLIDSALLSRFEEQIEIGLPDEAMRLQILAGAFARLGIPPPLPAQTTALTLGMSGRDLDALAKRIAREHGTRAPISDETMAALTTAMRRQGSTATDASAGWDTLVLQDETLETLKTVAGLLQHAESFRKRGIGVPRGLLLYGPPGTGKTQIARTLANETGLRFIAASTADIKQGYLGQSGQKVRELFERARDSAPSLLFIDEIDIVASARGDQNDAIQTEIVGQLLQEMDGIVAQPQSVFVLAASNRRDRIDPAVLSRLPKQIEIPPPDRDGTERLLRLMLRGKPLAFELDQGAQALAERAAGRSGRDLRGWVESAEHRAVARAIQAGNPDTIAIELRDFD